MLGAEAAEHGDLVVVRGADAYRNLPNKTVRLLRYMLSSARGCAPWAGISSSSSSSSYSYWPDSCQSLARTSLSGPLQPAQ